MNPYLRRPLPRAGLGMTVMTDQADMKSAVSMGVMEGVSDITKWITVGAIATGLFMLLPKKWTSGIRRQVRKVF